MRALFVLGILLCCAFCSEAQDRHAEKALRKAMKGKPIERVKARNWERQRSVVCLDYTDTVFPNEALLRLKNIESVHMRGLTYERKRKVFAVPPIRLRIDTVKLKQLTCLKYVSLSGFDLRIPPEGLSVITDLEGLDLTLCHLESMPKDIGRMRKLRALVLRLNYLSDLPQEMAELDSLRSIDMVNNHFRHLPTALAGCASLERIYLSNDEIGDRKDGYEQEWAKISFDWPFPLCANHIDWRASAPELKALLDLPRLEFIRLHARLCKDQKIAREELGSSKIHFRKPFYCPDRFWGRVMSGPPDPPTPYDPGQRKCTCARMGH
ncbi:MAG: hypothetical protein ABI432_15690 [Flavobacteriales bacterium]